MNNFKHTQKLFSEISTFSNNQQHKKKKIHKKEIFFLLLLSIFFNTKSFANLIPNTAASAKVCEKLISIDNNYKKTLKENKSNQNAETKIKELIPMIKLGFEYKNPEDLNLHHQIAISFLAINSFNYDKGYDSESFKSNKTDMYWKFANDHRKYVIAGVQEISEDLEVPLEITMGYSGQVNLMLDKIQNVSREIYIKDKLTGNSYHITEEKINLTLNKGMYSNRFVLAFKKATVLSLENNILPKETTIYADNKNQNIVISKNQEIAIHKVALINILGKQTFFWNIEEQKNDYQLTLKNQIPKGMYIVKMNTNKGTINKKVVIE
ncbi:T9SS type A sorting domain-containing protein [Polaribacter sp. Z014]|uniref:T9SS type A sorting domain-containing protein n=1 Tax=Polaribacter sp. Z014 TaxID=2927126 RepID=UPI0020217BD5|nr:T9SS type A sorting domain-containing protein [Polaribacter sp. Z014]MCL7765391.1 T9SS type A sorting domain-containing protein [Polaribacter sp. Z014]